MADNKPDLTPEMLTEAAISAVLRKITDLVFKEIESREELHKKYIALSNELGQGVLNQRIGKHVRSYLSLENDGRTNSKLTILTKSFTMHETK